MQKIGSAVVKKCEKSKEQQGWLLKGRLDEAEELKLEVFVLDGFSNRMLKDIFFLFFKILFIFRQGEGRETK